MATKTIAEMTESDLQALVERLIDERLQRDPHDNWQAEVERQWMLMHPDDRTPEARAWLENELNPNRAEAYSPENDPILSGMFDAAPDLAERTKEILRAELGTQTISSLSPRFFGEREIRDESNLSPNNPNTQQEDDE